MSKIFGNEFEQGRLHATFRRYPVCVLTGPSHIGKMSFVQDLVNSHSAADDVLVVGSSVDDARNAIGFSLSRPVFGEEKFLVIDDAHLLSEPAQDAYLKLFEESRPYLRIIMVAEDHDILVPALRSRIVMVFHWRRLVEDEMKQFIEADSMSLDEEASSLCDGRPGLYHTIASSPALKSFHRELQKVIQGEGDNIIAPMPEILSDLKEPEKRDALIVLCESSVRNWMEKGVPRERLRGLSNFSAVLKRYPAANPEIYWSRFLLM